MLGVILDILLIILKIIGITLLVVLGLLLTLILVVLFVPIRYTSSGAFNKNEDGISYSISAKVTWLLHIVSVNCVFLNEKNVFQLRIFGIDLIKPENKTKSGKKTMKKKGKIQHTKEAVTADATEKKLQEVSVKEDVVKEALTEASKTTVKDTEAVIHEKVTEEKAAADNKKGFKDKIRGIFDKISQICDKIKKVSEVKNSFIAYLKKEESRAAIKEIKHIILKVLRHILPQKLDAKVKFGFEDPATTGNILGVSSILYGVYGDKLQLEPDFEHQVLEGEYSFKGRIRVITLLIAAWKLFKNKWIRDFISFSKKSVQGL